MIHLGILEIKPEDAAYLNSCLNLLPEFMQGKIKTYPRKDEQLRSTLARLILKQLLISQGFSADILNQYRVDEYGRPSINESIDFSISHADDYVMCAVSNTTRVGIDVEKIRDICIDDYSISLSDTELEELTNSENPIPDFFTLWTKKEAISKANGKGLAILLPDMVIGHDSAICGQMIWNLKKLSIAPDYAAHIAFNGTNELKTKQFKLMELL
jgi:4'-phosphopantetheinyl transferase